MFALSAFLAALFVLFGCGGGVSTAIQPANQASGPGSGSDPGSGPAPSSGDATATLTWAAPTTNVDGTPLTDLAGYKIYYGTEPGVYTSVDVGKVTTYVVTGLTKGQIYYFTVTDYDTNGIESDFSVVASKLL
jgi:hypothetical protein